MRATSRQSALKIERGGRLRLGGPWTRAAGWGAAWGAIYGFWLLAPEIVRRHRLESLHAGQWLLVIAALGALFVALGAALALPVGVALRARGGGRATRRVAAIAVALWLVPAYLASGVVIWAVRFGRLPELSPYLDALTAAAPAVAVAVGATLLVARLAANGPQVAQRDERLAGGVVLMVALGGALQLPALPPPPAPAVAAHALASSAVASLRRPLLVIGLDGGSWTALRPLLGSGRLPAFDALLRQGLHGEVEALWPPFWSTSAWGAIVTGHSREETGVFEDLAAEAPGLPPFQAPLDLDARLLPVKAVEYLLVHAGVLRVSPPPRAALRRPPVWEWLDRSGVATAVVRFNFTYPASGQAAIVISNRVVADLWDELGVRAADPARVAAPASRRDELLAPFTAPSPADGEALARVVPPPGAPRPRDVEIDPVELVGRVLPFDRRTFEAGRRLLASDPGLSVVLLHLGGLDNVSHAFWPYRFPEQFVRRPPADEVAALGPVLDRYLEFLDRGLGELVAAFPEPPNVIVVSDHGHAALENGAPWRGWHASPGIFLAAGPDFPHRPETLTISYYDIAPTILDLQRLTPPPAMRGRSWGAVPGT